MSYVSKVGHSLQLNTKCKLVNIERTYLLK